MQKIKNKIPIFIVLSLLVIAQVAKAQDNDLLLQKADSLFESKLYTQSLAIYHQLFEEQEVYAPQMLLKMAFINEGLGNFSKALYFLNIYYLKTGDQDVPVKMEDLASKHQLSGYQFTDTDLFLNYYDNYLPKIILAGLIICLLLTIFLVYQKKKGRRMTFPAIALVLALLLMTYMNNAKGKQKSGIISNGSTYVRSGPSSGAGVVDIIKSGHRVNILGQEDVWVKINWNGQQAYVRKNQLMILDQ